MARRKSARKGPELAGPPPRAERLGYQAAALALWLLIAYGNSLRGSFHFDDYALFSDPYITGTGFGWEILRLTQTRPLTYLSFHWNYLLGGFTPEGYHWVNLLLHGANVLLVLLIARRHFPPGMAWLPAALFAVHPLQTEAVDYIFARSSLLTTSFALLAFFLYLREKYPWSVVAFGVSLLAKEETVALPAFILLYDFVGRVGLKPAPTIRRRAPAGYFAATAALAVLAAARLFYVVHTLPEPPMGFQVKGISPLSYALTQARVVWTYLRMFVLPVGLNLDHDVTLSRGLLSPPSTLPALLGLAAVLGALAWRVARKDGLALWALGFFLLLAPSSSMVPQADLIFEHRTYFPLFCLAMAAAPVLWTGAARLAKTSAGRPGAPGRTSAGLAPGRWPGVAVAALLLAFTAGTILRNTVWRDEKSLWTDIQEKSSRKARPYLWLARAYAAKDPSRSRRLLEQGLALDPNQADLHVNLGAALLAENDARGALEHFRRAMALTRETADHWNNIGTARFRLGEVDAAIQSYTRALALDPCNYNARRNLVSVLSQLGRKDEAFRTGEVPAGCRLIPAQARELEDFRRSGKDLP